MVLHSVFDRHMYKVYGESKRDWQNIKNGNHAFNVGCGTLYYKHLELLFTMLSQTVSLYMSRRMIDILCLTNVQDEEYVTHFVSMCPKYRTVILKYINHY